MKRTIKKEDLLTLEEYIPIRRNMRSIMIMKKKKRRVYLGPFVVLNFENYETILSQIQEMLYIEKGGDEQVSEEIEAYNPLVPQGNELVATMLIEIEEEIRRKRILSKLGHIEKSLVLFIDNEEIIGTPEDDIDRTNEEGKTSAVHFITFKLSNSQISKFKKDVVKISFGINHKEYNHTAVISKECKNELLVDLV